MISFLMGLIVGAFVGMIAVSTWAISKINDLREESANLKVDLLHK